MAELFVGFPYRLNSCYFIWSTWGNFWSPMTGESERQDREKSNYQPTDNGQIGVTEKKTFNKRRTIHGSITWTFIFCIKFAKLRRVISKADNSLFYSPKHLRNFHDSFVIYIFTYRINPTIREIRGNQSCHRDQSMAYDRNPCMSHTWTWLDTSSCHQDTQ